MRGLDVITNSMDMSLSKLWEMVKDGILTRCSPWGHKESDTTEQLNNNNTLCCKIFVYTKHHNNTRRQELLLSPGHGGGRELK